MKRSLLLVFLVAGCGGLDVAEPRPFASEVSGTLAYEAPGTSFRGLTRALEVRPARLVGVEALSSGRVAGRAEVDAQGGFRVVADGPIDHLRFVARIDHGGYKLAVTRDRAGEQPHTFEVEPNEAGRYVAPDDTAAGEGGAFHLLDTLLRGEEVARGFDARHLPPLFAYWGRGVTHEWSFYEGEQPPNSGRYRLELLGGEPGRRGVTDTDEHDEAVVLHELGHFVFDRLASASSVGGQHPSGYFVDPGLAWEEGRATWFAAVVLGRPYYTDTIGIEPSGGLQVHSDLEGRNPPPRGLGSQESVEEVLWDLTDGSPELPEDQDADGAAISPARLFREMVAMGGAPRAYPCLPTFLRHLVDAGAVTEAEVLAVLDNGSLPRELLPTGGVAPWPLELPLGGEVSGRIDSISNPAPSGGPRLPRTGFDAVRTYRLEVSEAARITLALTIDAGDGPSDLDLELLDLHATELASSRGTGPRESISRQLEPGTYVVRVVDGGGGARARFRLRASR